MLRVLLWCLSATLLLAACASGPGKPGDAEILDRNPVPPEIDMGDSPSARAVQDLVANAQREYDKGDWQSAVAVAERALRIDRRQPAVYLILAKCYRAMGENGQALQFVEQGRRYLPEEYTPVGRELDWLAEALQ